jgi:hypothetical protein
LGSYTFSLDYFGDRIPVKAHVSETAGLARLSYKF